MAASPPTALQQTAALSCCRVDAEGEPVFGYLEHLGFMRTAPSSGSNTRHRRASCHLKGVNSTPNNFQKRAKRAEVQMPHMQRYVNRSHPPAAVTTQQSEVRAPAEAEVQHFLAGSAQARGVNEGHGSSPREEAVSLPV